MTIERELKALHCGQKSFYHKATIIETQENGITSLIQLKSYETIVCEIIFSHGEIAVSIESMYSKTTKRHIRDFIIQMFDITKWYIIEQDYKNGVTLWTF